MKPIIGLVPLVDEGRESYWMLPGYMRGVEQAGGVPVMLPLSDAPAAIETLAARCDGFLLTGGHDVSPALYGEETLPQCAVTCPGRDRMEKPLFEAALAADKPVFGICRGIQMINALLGGTLYQDLPTQHPSDTCHHMDAPYNRAAHEVALLPDTPLRTLMGQDSLGVNSCHHQAIKALAPRLSPMAVAPDGLIEAVWMPDRRFVWGVQWHPEFFDADHVPSQKLFDAFVAAC